jgi:hypothetical protein
LENRLIKLLKNRKTQILLAVIIILLAAYLVFVRSKPSIKKIPIPKGINQISVKSNIPKPITFKLSAAQQHNLQQLNNQEMNLIKNFIGNYLSLIYLPNIRMENVNLNRLLSPDSLANARFNGNRSVLTSFPKLKSKIVSTLNGNAVISNLQILYTKNLSPQFATMELSMKSSYLLKNQRRFLIDLKGSIFLELVGDEWRISGGNLSREQKMIEKAAGKKNES